MHYPSSLYRQSLSLFTDLYQLTMAYGYWKSGMADREVVFHLFFRKRPFNGGIAVAAGLETAIDFIQNFRFDATDLDYLCSLTGGDGKPLFEKAFLDYLKNFSFSCDIDAMPEGTPAFPQEPLLRVQGPLLQAQLLESPLLNIINFQTLIATKTSRISWAARPDPVIEFGLRRAQGFDGEIAVTRAAYIGGCESTSNVLGGKLFGIPVKGTHAHSWIMAFEEELHSFETYAKVLPHNCIFLIDTYDTVQGVQKAISVGKKLRQKGIEMVGVRLDSGDLAELSIQVRKLLDAAGFPKAKIMASNELDEYLIQDLKRQGARIDAWGVGTKLVTSYDQPALDGIYKLSAVRGNNGEWNYRLKVSDTIMKITNPGILQVRRFSDPQGYVADMIYDVHTQVKQPCKLVDQVDPMKTKTIPPECSSQELLVPIFRKGKCVYQTPPLSTIRDKALRELELFPSAMRRLLSPEPYPVGLERSLYEKKLRLIQTIRDVQ